MKRVLVFITLSVCCINLASAQLWQWTHHIGTGINATAPAIELAPDSTIWALSSALCPLSLDGIPLKCNSDILNRSDLRLMLSQYSLNGSMLKYRLLFPPHDSVYGHEDPMDLAIAPDGQLFVAGSFSNYLVFDNDTLYSDANGSNSDRDLRDGLICGLTPNGEVQWIVTGESKEEDAFTALASSNSHLYAALEDGHEFYGFSENSCIQQYNHTGGFVRQVCFPTFQVSSDISDLYWSEKKQRLFVCGWVGVGSPTTLFGDTTILQPGQHFFGASFHPNLDLDWISAAPISRIGSARSIVSIDEGVCISGWFNGTLTVGDTVLESLDGPINNEADGVVFCISSNGEIKWINQLRGLGSEGINSISTDAHSNLHCALSYNGIADFLYGDNEVLHLESNLSSASTVAVLDSQGDLLSTQNIQGSNGVAIWEDLIALDDSQTVVLGIFDGVILPDSNTIWATNIVSDPFIGKVSTVSLPDSIPPPIDTITPLQLYPNPGKGDYTLQGEFEQGQSYTIIIRSSDGKTIFKDSGVHDSGQQRLEITLNELPSGLYLLDYYSKTKISTIKFIHYK